MLLFIDILAMFISLNLTAANHVILMDIWWNPAVEGMHGFSAESSMEAVELIWIMMTIEQAIDRVHRIGQRLPVHVVRLVMDRTIEQKIIQLQQKKVKIIHRQRIN